jgi:hypothetical protein
MVSQFMSDENSISVQNEKYSNTIFKSSYWYGKILCQLFVNYNVGGHQSYSLVMKKGNMTLIHNIDKDNKMSFIKNVLRQLSKDELATIVKELE